ncbi:MAG TPA: sulfurtransferase [Solirubrobacteraceae bacterium]|nr:sulfurtransferase [Solirubrobacteraceae bacterium]
MPPPLIAAEELRAQLGNPSAPSILDVRWELIGGALREAYLAGHIPGAALVDLDRDLSDPPGAGGRHPLPPAERFTGAMQRVGVDSDRPVVVYDAANGMAAARAWWLLRYFGHPDARLLDGGIAAWQAAGGEVVDGEETPPPGSFVAQPGHMPLLDADGAAALARNGVLLDARAPERFSGEAEPIDPVGGHIPGARNRPTTLNVQRSGRFEDPDQLRAEFAEAGIGSGAEVGVYCGSGITAAHEVLALELAGIRAALYAGSWSDWITDPSRPVATGADDP